MGSFRVFESQQRSLSPQGESSSLASHVAQPADYYVMRSGSPSPSSSQLAHGLQRPMGRQAAETCLSASSGTSAIIRRSPKSGLTLSFRIPDTNGFVHVHLRDNGMLRLSHGAPLAYREYLTSQTFSDFQALHREAETIAQSVPQGIPQNDPYAPNLTREMRAAWVPWNAPGSSFTDPRNHRPEKFQYCVKAIAEWGDYEKFIAYPELVFKQLNSTSIVNEAFRGTFGSVGFILNVHGASFFGASPGDFGTNNQAIKQSPQELKRYLVSRAEEGLPSPADILRESPFAAEPFVEPYNEVMVLGTTPHGHRVEPCGVFIRSGYSIDHDLKRPGTLPYRFAQLSKERGWGEPVRI